MMNVSPSSGVVNVVIKMFGGTPVYFMGKPNCSDRFVWTSVWQTTGVAIIYILALTGVAVDLQSRDGGWSQQTRRTLHIDIPGILPTAIIMLVQFGRSRSV